MKVMGSQLIEAMLLLYVGVDYISVKDKGGGGNYAGKLEKDGNGGFILREDNGDEIRKFLASDVECLDHDGFMVFGEQQEDAIEVEVEVYSGWLTHKDNPGARIMPLEAAVALGWKTGLGLLRVMHYDHNGEKRLSPVVQTATAFMYYDDDANYCLVTPAWVVLAMGYEMVQIGWRETI